MMCNRIIIMCEGKVLASDTPENLQKLMASDGQIVAEIAAPLAELNECFEQMPEIQHSDVSPLDGDFHRCALTPHNGTDLRAHVYALARDRGWSLRELTRSRHSLEDIYVRLTRREEEEEET